jgi:DNA adenine methylase
MQKIEPFLKWPGGKRWLINNYSHLFPTKFRTYYEPFLGGAAVFFYLCPQSAVLSDSNAELINVYKHLKSDHHAISLSLAKLQKRHNKAIYYRLRASSPLDNLKKAIRFIYLNRTCFNGIYRVNLEGNFNVPMGSKNLIEYPSDYLCQISNILKSASIKISDFEPVIDSSSRGDFIYIDPPYTVMHNNNNFRKYNAKLFSWEDQIRLASSLERADRRGVFIMLSNADHKCLRDLYKDFGYHHTVERTSLLAASAANRVKSTELVITNYNPS